MSKITKHQKYLSKISELGCIVCRKWFGVYSSAEIHHLRTDAGIGQRGEKVIPLCPKHHRTGGYGIAFHAGKRRFEELYGTEEELWKLVQNLL